MFKRYIVALALAVGSLLQAQTPTAHITGNATGVVGALSSSYPVKAQVQVVGCGTQVPRIIPSGSVITNTYTTAALTQPTLTFDLALFGNDVISCGGQTYTTYALTWLINGFPAAPTATYRVVQGATCNVSDGTCLPIGFVPPIISKSAGLFCATGKVLQGFNSDYTPVCQTFTPSGALPVFKTGGVTNPTQSVLNLVGGTNITLVPDGAGNVVFNVSNAVPIVNGLFSSNLTVGNPTSLTTVTDPVLGVLNTALISKGTSINSSANGFAVLDSTGRPVAQVDGAGRLNLDGYQNGGPVIDLRNWTSLASGALIGHYAFGMVTDAGQAITSGGIFHVMNTSNQTNVTTGVFIKFASHLNASTCPSFCQPNGQVQFGPDTVTIYDVLPIEWRSSTTLAEIQGNINHVLQLRPRGSGDTFVFPNNSDSWLHLNPNTNLRFIDAGSIASIQAVNDAASAFIDMSIHASTLALNVETTVNGLLHVRDYITGQTGQPLTVRGLGATANDLVVQNAAGSSNNFIISEDGIATTRRNYKLTPQTLSSAGSCGGAQEGMIAAITDSNTTTPGATITGGSTNHVKGYCNGTNWIVD